MKKKLVFSILCIFLLAGSTTSVIGMKIEKSNVADVLTKTIDYLDIDDENETIPICMIYGPTTSLYTEIELIDGSESDISRLNRLFNKIIPRFIIPLAILFIENLTFKVSFKREPLADNSRFSYITFWGDYVNGTFENESYIVNTIHTVTVTNFTGIFLRYRAKPLRLTPSYFVFIGEYEKIFAIA